MSYRKENVTKITINSGGLGDSICCLPVVEHLLKREGKVSIYTNYSSSINPDDNLILCTSLKGVDIDRFNSLERTSDSIVIKAISNEDVRYRNRHLVENAFKSIGKDSVLSEMNYVKYTGRPSSTYDFISKKHVIINISYVTRARKIQNLLLEKIVNFILKKGYQPVFVGRDLFYGTVEYNNIYKSAGLDLTNKTTFNDILYILSKAKLLISADSGTIHLAGMTDIPIFGVYTTADPLYRLPIRNNILGYGCEYVVPKSPCYCNTGRFIFPMLVKSTNKDYNCVDGIDHEETLEKIERLLK